MQVQKVAKMLHNQLCHQQPDQSKRKRYYSHGQSSSYNVFVNFEQKSVHKALIEWIKKN